MAVADLSLRVAAGEVFVLLGPNGSGKTTLFRVLSTLIPLQEGEANIFGLQLAFRAGPDPPRLGVVFQAPSVDKKLTVEENIYHSGRLYGVRGGELRRRAGEMLTRLGLADRRKNLVETLSGGLRRRVELAQGMLHDRGCCCWTSRRPGSIPARGATFGSISNRSATTRA